MVSVKPEKWYSKQSEPCITLNIQGLAVTAYIDTPKCSSDVCVKGNKMTGSVCVQLSPEP